MKTKKSLILQEKELKHRSNESEISKDDHKKISKDKPMNKFAQIMGFMLFR